MGVGVWWSEREKQTLKLDQGTHLFNSERALNTVDSEPAICRWGYAIGLGFNMEGVGTVVETLGAERSMMMGSLRCGLVGYLLGGSSPRPLKPLKLHASWITFGKEYQNPLPSYFPFVTNKNSDASILLSHPTLPSRHLNAASTEPGIKRSAGLGPALPG